MAFSSGWARKRTRASETRAILALAAFYLCFWAGLLYDVLVIYLSKGVSASAGWYLYAAVAAEIILLVCGLQAFFSARVVFPGLALGIATLDLYGMHGLPMPYYSGLTWHVGKSVGSALWVTTLNFRWCSIGSTSFVLRGFRSLCCLSPGSYIAL